MDNKFNLKSITPRIFENMEYGTNLENLDKVKAWVKARENTLFAYLEKSSETPNGTSTVLVDCVDKGSLCTIFVPEFNTIQTIISKCGENFEWFSKNGPSDRTSMLTKLAGEIERSADLFAQIEAVARGVPVNETRNIQVSSLAQWFHYYSKFPLKLNLEYNTWKPQGIAVGVISNRNPLPQLGLFLAPALAAGYNVILQVGIKISLSAFLIQELARKVGIPEGTFRVIPSDEGELSPYLSSEKVDILTLFLELKDEQYRGINHSDKKIIHQSPCKTPIIVFEDSDLDSAVEGVIDMTWKRKSTWSANTLLVQENISSKMVDKLKARLKSMKVGPPHDKMIDISYPEDENLKRLQKLISLAESKGVEIFQTNDDKSSWSPTMLIGGKIQNDNEDFENNALTVLAFRSIDEAVNLANNSRQGIGATVWSENIGIVNEVSRKLKVSNVWVNNSLSNFSTDVTITPLKESGSGCLGGIEGFFEYVQINKNSNCSTMNRNVPLKTNSIIISKVNSAIKAQGNWNKMGYLERGRSLQQYADGIDDEQIKNLIYSFTIGFPHLGFCANSNGYHLTSIRDPKGVIVIEKLSIKVLVAALLHGNVVILIEDSPADICNKLSQYLPAGVFTILSNTLENVKTIASHNQVNCFIGNGNAIIGMLPFKNSLIFTQTRDNLEDICRKVTVNKNIWLNIGKSITFNM